MRPQASLRPRATARSNGLHQRQFVVARAFCVTLLFISVLTLWSITRPVSHEAKVGITQQPAKRDLLSSPNELGLLGKVTTLARRDEEVRNHIHVVQTFTDAKQCRLVHRAPDQCAFVRNNCPDEEAGLLSYLRLYYCKLPNAKPVAFIIIVLWLALLFSTIGIAASDFFCIDLSTIASILGMSESMAGVTFLAFGNGSPDVFSTFAAMRTHNGSLAVGELIGAAGFITAVVAGSMALVRPFKVARKSFVRDVGFFIIAASFSMVFLADGHLSWWECAAMVGFYVFYVVIVLLWHWFMKRRACRRLLEDTARSHYHLPDADEADVQPYRDEIDEETRGTHPLPSRTISTDDFNNLERASSPLLRSLDEEVDMDDDARDRYLAEISSNMRVSRPNPGGRRPTTTPIRPSLFGALEFNAVLSSLHKSRNLQALPMSLRRYSEDAIALLNRQEHQRRRSASYSDVTQRFDSARPEGDTGVHVDYGTTGPNRTRAKSTNDVSSGQKLLIPEIDLPPDSAPTDDDGGRREQAVITQVAALPDPSSAPPPHGQDHPPSSLLPVAPPAKPHSEESLPPPGDQVQRPWSGRATLSPLSLDPGSSRLSTGLTAKPKAPRLDIPPSTGNSQRSSPISPFPAYYDDPNLVPISRANSFRLPPASLSPESSFHPQEYSEDDEKHLWWWPYSILPTPRNLASTLFPTLYAWRDKNLWEKMLGVIAAPSVFLLAITLPVVEVDKDDEVVIEAPVTSSRLESPDQEDPSKLTVRVALAPESPSEIPSKDLSHGVVDDSGRPANAGEPVAINITPPSDQTPALPQQFPTKKVQDQSVPQGPSSASFKDWNRWLVIIQIFTAPLFVALLVHANMDSSSARGLVLSVLFSLIGSLSVSLLLLLLTTPDRAPRFRYLLCFIGFVVSIAWISTIAGEVVGALKALGIILNISDAILGLTIFAVGNSLGDLVADITVARLGYPVMALSACFGGPMLNILLGIGLSGLYMTIRGGERRHEKHPDQPLKYKPYQIEVGQTLLVSGVALLVTLLGLLIVVPLRGWWMDRRVGAGLIALWVLSTVGNVIVEAVGV